MAKPKKTWLGWCGDKIWAGLKAATGLLAVQYAARGADASLYYVENCDMRKIGPYPDSTNATGDESFQCLIENQSDRINTRVVPVITQECAVVQDPETTPPECLNQTYAHFRTLLATGSSAGCCNVDVKLEPDKINVVRIQVGENSNDTNCGVLPPQNPGSSYIRSTPATRQCITNNNQAYNPRFKILGCKPVDSSENTPENTVCYAP